MDLPHVAASVGHVLGNDACMRSHAVVMSVVGVGVSVLAGCSSSADSPTSSSASSTSPEGKPVVTTYAKASPPNAATQSMTLYSVSIPPGGEIPLHQHPGEQLATVVSGDLTYTVQRGTAVVFDGTAGANEVPASRNVTGPTTITLPAGSSVAERAGMVHMGQNKGTVPVVIYASVIVPTGHPNSVPEKP